MSEIDAVKREIDTYKMFLKIREQQAKKDKYKNYSQDGLIDEILEQEEEIERLNNIIKEVREYIETIVKNTPSSTRKDYANMLLIDYKKLLEILGSEKE